MNDEIYPCRGKFGVNVEGWLTCISGSLFLGEIKRERWNTNLGGGGEQMILRQTVLDFGFNF